jgi:hypothetical protein
MAHYAPENARSGFYESEYAIPSELTLGKKQVTVRFEATGRERIAGVFGVRTVRR